MRVPAQRYAFQLTYQGTPIRQSFDTLALVTSMALSVSVFRTYGYGGFLMSKGLKYRWLVAAPLASGCVCLLSLALAGYNGATSSATTDSAASVTARSAPSLRAAKASASDLAGRRYRRYWRRHTV